jgi:hypothetical protein
LEYLDPMVPEVRRAKRMAASALRIPDVVEVRCRF